MTRGATGARQTRKLCAVTAGRADEGSEIGRGFEADASFGTGLAGVMVVIAGLTDGGAIPVLERVAQFTAARHEQLAHNIANLDTPYFKPADLAPAQFQAQLRDAVERRRRSERPISGRLNLRDSRDIRFGKHGIEARPSFINENIMFHDRNNRDLERIMQDVAENTLAHTAALELLRGEFTLLRTAIRERI